NCNNSVTCSVTRSGGDTEDPTLIDPMADCSTLNITGVNECNSEATAFDATTLEASVAALYEDNCDASVSAVLTNTTAGMGNTDCNWSYTYEYTISDNCNNSVTCSVTRSGGDTEDPTLIDPMADCSTLNITGVNECNSEATAFDATTLEASVAALYEDNCDASVSAVLTNTTAGMGNTDCNWSYTYEYTISDNCNNSVTCSVTRSGSDETPPNITECPVPRSVEGCNTS